MKSHESWRESALGRGYIEKDRFAYYESRVGNRPCKVTTEGLKYFGESIELLLDIDPGGSVAVDLTNQDGDTVQEGFEAQRCKLEPVGGGWHKLSWAGSSVGELDSETLYALRITMNKAKFWAIRGDFYVRPLKYSKGWRELAVNG